MLWHTHPGAAEDWWLDMWTELPLIEIRQLQTVREAEGNHFNHSHPVLAHLDRAFPLPAVCNTELTGAWHREVKAKGGSVTASRLHTPLHLYLTCTFLTSPWLSNPPIPGLGTPRGEQAVPFHEQRRNKNDKPHCSRGLNPWCYHPLILFRILLFAFQWTEAKRKEVMGNCQCIT